MTLTTVGFDKDPKSVSEIGSMLFKRGVSGARVVTGKEIKDVEGFTFYGKHFINLKQTFFVLLNTRGFILSTLQSQGKA